MHIPDGFLAPEVAAGAGVLAAGAVAYGLRRADRTLDERAVPLLGVTGAFVFAAQMLNFPVAGGTSGHFLGAALAAVLLGPWMACLVLAVVLAMQAFVFADGGVTALGANVLNMGVIGGLGAGLVLAAGRRVLPDTAHRVPRARRHRRVGRRHGGRGGDRGQLALSGTVPLGTVLPAMLGVHALIGVGEAVVTVAAVSAVLASRPDLVGARRRRSRRRPPADGGLTCGSSRCSPWRVAIGLATAVSPLASSSPDGLEKVAEDQGFLDEGRLAGVQEDAPVPDYAFPGCRRPAPGHRPGRLHRHAAASSPPATASRACASAAAPRA